MTAPSSSERRGRRRSLVWVNQFAVLPRDGGGTRHFELGRELVRLGWDVTVVASDYHPQRRTYTRRASGDDHSMIEEMVDGVKFRWLWAASYQGNNWRRAINWLSFHRSVLTMPALAGAADVVIGSSPQLFAATGARALARRLRVPFVLEVRDLWPESFVAAGGRKGPAYFALARVAAGLYRDARKIIVLAAGSGRYLAANGVTPAKIAHVPNGVDVHLVQPRAEGSSEHGLESEGMALIYAGAHGPANGLDVVLEAASRLEAAGEPIRFVLIGDGPQKAALVAEAARRGLRSITFKDPVPKADLARLLTTVDAGLMLLRDAELFAFAVSPNKLFDYLSSGIPVVCNVPGEVAELLAASGGGVQTRDSSPDSLVAAIQRLRALPRGQRRQLGSAGRAWVAEHHSREVLGVRLDETLREVIASA